MRIAIAHRHPPVLAALLRFVAGKPELELAWVAGDAAATIAQCMSARPDLLLLDLSLPDMAAADVVHRIMNVSPCPILVMTGNASTATHAPYQCLAAGALDAVSVTLPGTDALERKLHQLQHILPSSRVPRTPAAVTAPTDQLEPLLLIGASTGGPAVIARILAALPTPLPVPCVIIQHMSPEFVPGMAAWLATETHHPVTVAIAGTRPVPGQIYVAASPGHLVLDARGRLAYCEEPSDYPYQPSIDEFFLSACGGAWPAWALLLTGMGRDGARGLAALRHHGWTTIAQDPASCAVSGMPQAAIDIGAACKVLDVPDIASLLHDLLNKEQP